MSFKSNLSAPLAAACCALAVSVGIAKADSIFDIQGTFSTGLGGTLSGTLTIDVTAPGSVTAIDAVYSGTPRFHYTVLIGSDPIQGRWQVIARDVALNHVQVSFSTPPIVPPALGTLVDFNGGPILAGSVICIGSVCPFPSTAGDPSGGITLVPGPSGCRTARPDLGERRPSRLVATAAEKCLSFRRNAHVVCGSHRLPNNRDL
jgi:hypothetical protein